MVIAQFEAAIEQIVALAVLMPIVASMGGNGGTQTVTVVVRALATREITPANAHARARQGDRGRRPQRSAVPDHRRAGAVLWFGDLVSGVLFGVALLIALIFAALAGVGDSARLFDRLGVDPAVASGVFMTTVTDGSDSSLPRARFVLSALGAAWLSSPALR